MKRRCIRRGPAWDGSAYERYAIYAKFNNLIDGNEFWFITTHFDHLGQKVRQESAKIVMDLAERLDAPAIVTGDFNCFPQLGGAELYQLLSTRSTRIKDSESITDKIFGVPGSWIGWDYDTYKQRNGYSKYDSYLRTTPLESYNMASSTIESGTTTSKKSSTHPITAPY